MHETEPGVVGAGTRQLYHPLGLWIADDASALFVGDSLNHRVQRYDLRNGQVTTVAKELEGQPMCVFVDTDGALWVSDSCTVQRISPASQDLNAKGTEHAENEQNEVKSGRCSMYRERSGYGFIVGDDGCKYFAHHSDIEASNVRFGYPRLTQGERLDFLARRDSKWEWRATGITGPHGAPVEFR